MVNKSEKLKQKIQNDLCCNRLRKVVLDRWPVRKVQALPSIRNLEISLLHMLSFWTMHIITIPHTRANAVHYSSCLIRTVKIDQRCLFLTKTKTLSLCIRYPTMKSSIKETKCNRVPNTTWAPWARLAR